MIEEYVEYLSLLYKRIPDYVYFGGLALFALGTVSALFMSGLSKVSRVMAKLALFEYIVLTYCSTVIFRKTDEDLKVELQPLKKIIEAINGGSYYSNPELIMNVIVFVFLGILLGLAYDRMKWWRLLLAGFVISLLIETMQLFFQRGTAETDDVILNSLGCLIGIFIVSIAKKMTRCQPLYSLTKDQRISSRHSINLLRHGSVTSYQKKSPAGITAGRDSLKDYEKEVRWKMEEGRCISQG